LVHTLAREYRSFIILLFALYTVAGGILVTGDIRGTPPVNTLLLGLGTVLASVVGTTGAAMILIRPLLRANATRQYNVHVIVFFIFLVANIGGALTPLGDPPLFIGFLRGVDFLWTAEHLAAETAFVAGTVLLAFLALDTWFFRREPNLAAPARRRRKVRVHGLINLLLIAGIIATLLLSAGWEPRQTVTVLGTELPLPDIVRDAVLLVLALLSLWWTPDEHRLENGFNWEPMKEVAKLFAAIFITIIPVLAMLQAGEAGAFAPLLHLVSGANGDPSPLAYFWLTGLLSAFLDNAPTYLVFFELAGGSAEQLMTTLAGTLAAISMGAVYMGALTYVGNAPNFMVYAIAVERGIRMPNFLAYFGWAALWLAPVFILLSIVSIGRS
jgi:Na+/H+ antiporter NhaD/arsenite permease-like protein